MYKTVISFLSTNYNFRVLTCNWATYSTCIRKQKTHLFQILTTKPPIKPSVSTLGTPLPSPRVLTSVPSPTSLITTVQSTTAKATNEADDTEGSGGEECIPGADGGNLEYC